MHFFSGENMTGGYGGADIISSCTINVNRGEIVAILGPNGAGKSTAMKAMLGLLKLKTGKVFIDGKDIGDADVLAQVIDSTGLDIDHEVAHSTATHRQLEQDLFMARQLQLDGVPYFIFAEQYAVAGAHVPEHFLPVIDAAAA